MIRSRTSDLRLAGDGGLKYGISVKYGRLGNTIAHLPVKTGCKGSPVKTKWHQSILLATDACSVKDARPTVTFAYI